MSDAEKDLTYEEAKELCRKAFDGGVTYISESMRYHCDAVAYDWEHWLKQNERLFMPAPTVESTLREMLAEIGEGGVYAEDMLLAKYAPRLRLAGDAE